MSGLTDFVLQVDARGFVQIPVSTGETWEAVIADPGHNWSWGDTRTCNFMGTTLTSSHDQQKAIVNENLGALLAVYSSFGFAQRPSGNLNCGIFDLADNDPLSDWNTWSRIFGYVAGVPRSSAPPPFYVKPGPTYLGTAPQNGFLIFLMNDAGGSYSDNSGTYNLQFNTSLATDVNPGCLVP
jgi:hypothetical protein